MLRALQQLALVQRDIPEAVRFYRDVLGLTLTFESAGMAFFDIAGVRLMLTLPSAPEFDHANSVIYFDVADAEGAYAAIIGRGATAERPPALVGRTATHEVTIAFVRDPEGNLIGLSAQRAITG